MTLIERGKRWLDIGSCVVTASWRPLCCVGFVLSLFVHGVFLPLATHKPADLPGLALLVTAIVGAFAVREVGKYVGTAK